jgi:hypothetical protein
VSLRQVNKGLNEGSGILMLYIVSFLIDFIIEINAIEEELVVFMFWLL